MGHVYPRPSLPPLFKEHKVCSFDSGDGSYMLYVITLKEFNHTKCEALDLKSQAHVQGGAWRGGKGGIVLSKTLGLYLPTCQI